MLGKPIFFDPTGKRARLLQALAWAAGTVSAFGTVYAAYALYQFIGAPAAFVLLGIIGVATMLAAALHGPALAGLGLAGSLVVPLLVPWIRERLGRYVWMSFIAGFGQTPISVLTGIGVLAGAALFIYWQVAAVATGGRYPAGVFSGYAAGIGILVAQAALVRRLEQSPEIRALIEEP